jgi:glycosyltransferase involved in cell wall biosynthesis
MSTEHRTIRESTFLLVANGEPDQPPLSGVEDYLISRGAKTVTSVFHPLNPEDDGLHQIRVFEPGRRPRLRTLRLPTRPPYTFPLDMLWPVWPRPVDVWFAFNNLHALRGLAARAAGRANHVVYWGVDFVPDRFGSGALTTAFDAVDRYCCRHVDTWIDLSTAALEGRRERHGLDDGTAARSLVVPIGVSLARLPQIPADALARRRIVFLGHLVPRQGVGLILEALEILARREVDVTLEVVGSGPLLEDLKADARRRALDGRATFHGYVKEHRDVEAFLATGSIALAPYDNRGENFTRFADPGKLKSYVAAGLPIITTDVPPNASDLVEHAGAEVIDFSAVALADAVEKLLDDHVEWSRRREAALSYIQDFDWDRLVEPILQELGYSAG